MLDQGGFDDADVAVTSEATKAKTGFFEVSVNDELLHSKKAGDGFPNQAKIAAVVAAITKALE